MKIINHIEEVHPQYPNPVIAIGVFDGVHRGHQELIRRAVRRARAVKGTAVVLTFWPHPVQVLKPEIHLPLLTSLPHRLQLIEALGVDLCVIIPFTRAFSQLSPQQFIEKYLIKRFKPKDIFVGYDFRFGKNRTGDMKIFRAMGKDHGFHVTTIEAIKGQQSVISSTHIRELIATGQLRRAGQLLGRPVSLMGVVVRGDARGKTLGFPTANINPSFEVLPPSGVYVVNVKVGKIIYHGMANVGRRPSFHKGNGRINIEVHIFNFHKMIYGQSILIEFLRKIRDEKAFNSKEQLIEQLHKDEKKARHRFIR